MGLFEVRTPGAEVMARAKALWQAGLWDSRNLKDAGGQGERWWGPDSRGCTTFGPCGLLYLAPDTGLASSAPVSCSHFCSRNVCGGQPVELEQSRPASFWQLCVPAFEGGGNWGWMRPSCSLLLLWGVRGMTGGGRWGGGCS